MNKKRIFSVLGLFFALSCVFAGNERLDRPQAIMTGERIAYYLQSLLLSAGAILETKGSGDIFRIGVTYDPVLHVIEISMVGNQGDPDKARMELELVEKLIMNFNKKLLRNFGVTLAPEDLSMDYLNAKAGKVVLKYRNGEFFEPGPAPQPDDKIATVSPTSKP